MNSLKCVGVILIILGGAPAAANASDGSVRTLQHEKIEWTWSDRPDQPDPQLPNVLLEGDSITRNYYEPVQTLLKGQANVYLFATSLSAGDPRLAGQIRDYLTGRPITFSIIHLNNGMHGADYTIKDFSAYYRELMSPIKGLAPQAKCIVATTTPVRKDLPDYPTNTEIDQRNAAAIAYATEFSCALDDQHGLMMRHQDLHSDDVHFGPEGSAIQARQVAASIEALLPGHAK